MYHNLSLAVIKEARPDGDVYRGVRYCSDCKLAEPALGFFVKPPDRAPVLRKNQITLLEGGMPERCNAAILMVKTPAKGVAISDQEESARRSQKARV